MTDLTDILTVRDAATWLGISRAAIYQAIAANRLPSIEVLGHTAISKKALIEYDQARRDKRIARAQAARPSK